MSAGARWRHPAIVLPLLILLAAAVYVGVGVTMRPTAPVLADASSAGERMDVAAPAFDLPSLVPGGAGLADRNFAGRVTVVNFFASWCVPCRIEAPTLSQLGSQARLVGIAFRDDSSAAVRWLGETRVPFELTGADHDGKAGIAWGVFGLPATFIVDGQGHIRYRHLGLLTHEEVERDLTPLLRELNRS